MRSRKSCLQPSKLLMYTLAFAAAIILVGSQSHAGEGDDYMCVGGDSMAIYFVPVSGSNDAFPEGHEADFYVEKLDGNKYDPQGNAPISISPTDATAAGGRIPGATASLEVAPTTDTAKAGKAKIGFEFPRDYVEEDDGSAHPSRWVSVDKWVVVSVEIGDVERAPGLPFSLPPGQPKDVSVTINPALTGSGHDIEFDVINGSADNGTATVTANATRDATGAITITGGNQTEPGHSGNLNIRSRLDGIADCDTSTGFSVCAHPQKVSHAYQWLLEPFVNEAGKKHWGACYLISVGSDSTGTLDEVRICENIETIEASGALRNHTKTTGVFFEATAAMQDNNAVGGVGSAQAMIDYLEQHNNEGTAVQEQFYRFSCARCGIGEDSEAGPIVPKSGFQVTLTVSKEDGKHYVNVRKQGKDIPDNPAVAGQVGDETLKKAEVKD
mgnify:CR=1 FL=1